jgi:hypothetical protein
MELAGSIYQNHDWWGVETQDVRGLIRELPQCRKRRADAHNFQAL